MRFLLTLLSYLLAVSSQQLLPTIHLRPKPKARAGGADDEAAAIFSFAFYSIVSFPTKHKRFSLSIGILMDDIWIMDSDCENCKLTSAQYNTSEENVTSLRKSASYKNDLLNLDAEGAYYEDLIQIPGYSNLTFPIVVCSKFVDVLGLAIDGILGLGHNKSSLVYKMYKEEKIDKPIYSLSFLTLPYLVLGTPNFLDLSLVIQSQQTIKYKSRFEVSVFQFGDFKTDEVVGAEMSSISSYITGPFEILEHIYKILTEHECHYEEELLMCECEGTDYPELRFTIQGEVFSLKSSNYLIKLGDNCFLGIKSGDHWVLGEPFFKEFFFEFNLESQDITLYKTSALTTQLPSPFETTEGWATMIGLGIASLGLYVVAFMAFLKYEDKKITEYSTEEYRRRRPRIL